MPVEPHIHLHWPALATAVLVSMILSFLWFGPIFGRTWAREMKFAPDFRPTAAAMIKATVLQLIGTLLTVYVLAHSEEVWRPFSSWGLGTTDGPNWMYGVMSAGFTWIGFQVPLLLSAIGWEHKTWKLFGINAAGNLVTLLAQGMILATWR
ncbi:MAG: hypothetical protein JWP91_3307 [Fibrobacteres bacterium]|nr:hypothetical protein [Fibrobacterota bacterium]